MIAAAVAVVVLALIELWARRRASRQLAALADAIPDAKLAVGSRRRRAQTDSDGLPGAEADGLSWPVNAGVVSQTAGVPENRPGSALERAAPADRPTAQSADPESTSRNLDRVCPDTTPRRADRSP